MPIQDHVHGVVTVRCDHADCKAAWSRYSKRWRYDRAHGRKRTVASDKVREHCETLNKAGWSVRGIAESAGTSPSVVSRLLRGEQTTITRKVARALLALSAELMGDRKAPRGFVPKVGTVRRLGALMALGWSAELLGEHLGRNRQFVYNKLNQRGEWVTRDVRDDVAALYERLSMTLPPETTPREKVAASRARTAARKAGWLPPLAWDDDQLDDPNYQPRKPRKESLGVDEAVVERFLASGERPGRKFSHAEAAEIVRRLRLRGHTTWEIENHYGLKPERYKEGTAS